MQSVQYIIIGVTEENAEIIKLLISSELKGTGWLNVSRENGMWQYKKGNETRWLMHVANDKGLCNVALMEN